MICRFEQGTARREITPVDNQFIADYLPKAPGLYVQVYLYGLMQCYHPALAEGSVDQALGISPQAVEEAYAYWQKEGLVRIVSADPFTVEYATLGTGERREAVPLKYGDLIRSLNTLTAPRQFGMRELRHVYDWIELYHLSEGAVLTLVSHCLEKRKNCSVGYMTSVAQSWSLAGVETQEQAIEYLADSDVRSHGAKAILNAWHLRRPPTEDEMARYNRWTKDWGFTHETILRVLPRLSKTAAPSFDKLDELLLELYEQGKATAAAVEQDDAAAMEKKAFAKAVFLRAGKAEQPTLSQMNQLEMYEKELGLSRELIFFGADCARGTNEPFGYLKKKLNDWHEAGITDPAGAEQFEESRRPRGRKEQKGTSLYKNEDFLQFEVNLDED